MLSPGFFQGMAKFINITLYFEVMFDINFKYSRQNVNNNPSNFNICTYVQKWRSSEQGMALTLRDGGAIS